jgi:predicted nucleic acid-binding protein
MVAVSDTSPLSNLAITGRLGLVREQFGTVLVPSAVRQELSRLRHTAATGLIDAALADGWLRVTPLRQAVPRETAAGLHLGEAEAIALALEQRADLVLLDDGDARRRASEIGLHFIGVPGILLRTKQHGRIPALREEIRRLREEARFFVASKLGAELLIAAGEEPA